MNQQLVLSIKDIMPNAILSIGGNAELPDTCMQGEWTQLLFYNKQQELITICDKHIQEDCGRVLVLLMIESGYDVAHRRDYKDGNRARRNIEMPGVIE